MGLKSLNGFGHQKHQVYLVEEHAILREGLAYLINREADLHVCGTSSDGPRALKQIAELRPALVITGIELKQVSGLELIRWVKVQLPEVPILVLSMLAETLYAERALRAGARGYVMKQCTVGEVMGAIRWVLRGERYLSVQMQQRLLKFFSEEEGNGSNLELLSERELQVFDMLGQGRRMQEIAARLSVSVKTIETHRSHLIQKLNLKTGLELLQYAVQTVAEQRNSEEGPASQAKRH